MHWPRCKQGSQVCRGAVSKPTGLKQRLCQPSLPIVMRMAQKGTGAGLRRLGKWVGRFEDVLKVERNEYHVLRRAMP